LIFHAGGEDGGRSTGGVKAKSLSGSAGGSWKLLAALIVLRECSRDEKRKGEGVEEEGQEAEEGVGEAQVA
jgi:hypothetical protein